jgi:pimeloyl-ACP methyl ester carboxylesterase
MRVNVGDVELEVAVDGEDGAPAVLLLHGWPDTHDLWRNQVVALTAAGYRTVAPDLRGFGASDKPSDPEAYNMLSLAGDVANLLDALDIPRAHVVGHDWGAGLAWVLGAFLPDRVDHLVALSVGHPRALADAGFEQLEKSWYMLFFQFAGTAEQWLTADGGAHFRDWARHPEHDAVVARWADPAAVTGGLNWYRANVPAERLVRSPLEFPPIAAPTLGVWSDGDVFLTEAGMATSGPFVAGPYRYERVEGCGHWIPLEAPDRLNRLLLDFLPAPA